MSKIGVMLSLSFATMATRATAALPMECTGGFKALRKHVKGAKDGAVALSDREQEWDDSKPLQPLECHSDARDNQARFSQEEHNLNMIRLALAKEQREIKTRERSVKAMETVLQEAMDRTAEKETSLDQRIQDITRLEQRLHEALNKTNSPRMDPQQETVQANQNDHALEDRNRQLEERETTLTLREQELSMARDRVADRERHLSTKERVLRDKATELAHLQTELEKKDAQRAALAEARLAELERDLQSQHASQEHELVERFQAQLASLAAEFGAKRLALEEQAAAVSREMQARAAQLDVQEATLRQGEFALMQSQSVIDTATKDLALARERAAMTGEDAASRAVALAALTTEVSERIEQADVAKRRYDEAVAALKRQETKLALFAAEVEAQAQFNATERHQLEIDRIAFENRVAAAVPNQPVAAAQATMPPNTADAPPAHPPRSRSFTSGLFRSKSTTRS